MKRILIVLAVVAAFASCRKQPDYDALTYKAIVVTNHSAKADFASYQTYFLPNNVGEIGDDPNDTILDQGVAQPIIDAIKKNMDSRGYTQVSNQLTAHLGFKIVTIKVTTVGTYYPGYWWGYGYGGYYPYYPYYPYSYTYSYSTGSLVMDIIDLKNANNTTNTADILWTNFDTGVLGSSVTGTSNTKLATDAINQAFVQSPYIHTN